MIDNLTFDRVNKEGGSKNDATKALSITLLLIHYHNTLADIVRGQQSMSTIVHDNSNNNFLIVTPLHIPGVIMNR